MLRLSRHEAQGTSGRMTAAPVKHRLISLSVQPAMRESEKRLLKLSMMQVMWKRERKVILGKSDNKYIAQSSFHLDFIR